MRLLVPLLALTILLTSSLTPPAMAVESGKIGLYYDPLGQQLEGHGLYYADQFDVYLVASDLEYGLLGFEFAVEITGNTFLIGHEFNPAFDRNTTINVSPFPNGYLVGTGGCAFIDGPVWLVKFTLFSPENLPDAEIRVIPYPAPTLGLEAQGGWLDCLYNLHPFDFQSNGYDRSSLEIFDPCPPRVYDWRIEMPDTQAAPGTTAMVALDIPLVFSKCIGPVNVPLHVEFTLDFDPAVAQFEQMIHILGPENADISSAPLGPGSVRIVADSIDPFTGDELAWFQLQFQMSEEEGTTVLSTRDIVAWDAGNHPVTMMMGTAILSSRPVSNSTLSIGRLKARY